MDIEEYAKVHPKDKPAKISDATLERISKLSKGSEILDIGCAEGSTIQWLNSLFGSKFKYTGVDLSETRINKAKSRRIPSANFVVSTGESIPLEPESFDCILCSQVLEHVESEDALLSEILRLLKPGGIYQVDTVFKKKWAWYFYRSPMGWALDPTHLREYTNTDSVRRIFDRNQLKVETIYTVQMSRDLNKIMPFKLEIPVPGYYFLFVEGEK